MNEVRNRKDLLLISKTELDNMIKKAEETGFKKGYEKGKAEQPKPTSKKAKSVVKSPEGENVEFRSTVAEQNNE